MSDANPYLYQAEAGDGIREEPELLDEEARHRIAEALQSSYRPMQVFAILVLLFAILTLGMVLFFTGLFGAGSFRKDRPAEVLIFFVSIGIPLTFGISAFFVAGWLWSCTNAIGRACSRLTIASLAVAVQTQSLFWKKLGFLSLVITALVIGLNVFLFILNEYYR